MKKVLIQERGIRKKESCGCNKGILVDGLVRTILCRKKKDDLHLFKLFCPQAGLALTFPFDEK